MSNWLTCQISGIADYICHSMAPLNVLRNFAGEFRATAERIEAEIARREREREGMFG
jgi:hypothetical protein